MQKAMLTGANGRNDLNLTKRSNLNPDGPTALKGHNYSYKGFYYH